MKEDVKMKENMNSEPMGMMPHVGAMQNMQAAPNVLPAQTNANMLPMQQAPMGVMPSMMNPMPMMMCCPYLMNMQCPMTLGQNVMGMNMMSNPMYTGVSPVSGNMNPVLGAANSGMNPVLGAANNGMGMMPSMNQFYPMGGM